MAREINRLTTRTVSSLKEAGLHADGKGLYLDIKPSGTKSWAFIYFLGKKRCYMGLGSTADVSLGQARNRRDELRVLVKQGLDPRPDKAAAKSDDAEGSPVKNTGHTGPSDLFKNVAASLIESMKPSWKNEKHAQQWENTLTTHAAALMDKKVW